jgi:cytoskeletal protein CcmA (bactofilin family)
MAEIKEVIEDENKIGTVMGEDITFRGKIAFKDSLKIKGNVEGTIESDGHLVIGMEAKVSAEITAGTISVSGNTNGKIHAKKQVELFSKSNTNADIVSPELYIERGANFNGNCNMQQDSK